jgi:hypothetical protein
MTTPLVHAGYALMLCALVARDVLWLRAILAVAQFNLSLYGFTQHLAGVTGWNALFVVINVAWVIRILRERRAIELPPMLVSIHAGHFMALTTGEFLRFWSLGRETVIRDTTVVRQGECPSSLYFLASGEAGVVRDGREIARLHAGQFAAEMGLLTGEAASADVIAHGEVTLRCWPFEQLRTLRAGQPALWSKLQSVLGYDLIEKIRAASRSPAPVPGR